MGSIQSWKSFVWFKNPSFEAAVLRLVDQDLLRLCRCQGVTLHRKAWPTWGNVKVIERSFGKFEALGMTFLLSTSLIRLISKKIIDRVLISLPVPPFLCLSSIFDSEKTWSIEIHWDRLRSIALPGTRRLVHCNSWRHCSVQLGGPALIVAVALDFKRTTRRLEDHERWRK